MAIASSPGIAKREPAPESPEELREIARRVRVIASVVNDAKERRRLLGYARKLEALAAAQEQKTSAKGEGTKGDG